MDSSLIGCANLGNPVVPFYPFYLGVSLLKLNSRKKGTLIIKGLLGNLEMNRGSQSCGPIYHILSG